MRTVSMVFALVGAALLLMSFVPRTAPAAAPMDDAAYGQALFAAKGCAQCHAHAAIIDSGMFADAYGANGAPNLTTYKAAPEFLRAWLKDPAAVRPGTAMPTLGLSDDEIAALIAFLNADASKTP